MRELEGSPEKSLMSNEAVGGLSSGLRVMMAPDFLQGEKYREQQLRANRVGAHEKILLFEQKFVKRMARLNVPMFAHNMVRTREEQDELYARKVTFSRGGDSPHNYGLAVDIIHSIKAWDLTEESWRLIGHIGNEVAKQNSIRLRWGGDWDGDGDIRDQKLFDPAHWELLNWRSIAGM